MSTAGGNIPQGPVLILGGTSALALALATRLLDLGLPVALTSRTAEGDAHILGEPGLRHYTRHLVHDGANVACNPERAPTGPSLAIIRMASNAATMPTATLDAMPDAVPSAAHDATFDTKFEAASNAKLDTKSDAAPSATPDATRVSFTQQTAPMTDAASAASPATAGPQHSPRTPRAALPETLPETLPEACESALGQTPRHLVDLMHSRFESLVASASPEDIVQWAAQDIALRARCLRAVSRAMLSRRAGRCLFISSTAASAAATGQGFYAAAKLAGEALYSSVGIELGGRGVTTCSLRLGWIDSGRGESFLQTVDATLLELIPLRRTVTIAEATDAILHQLSAPAAAFNATTLTLDGGFTAAKPMPPRARHNKTNAR